MEQEKRSRQKELQLELLRKQAEQQADFTGVDDHDAKSG